MATLRKRLRLLFGKEDVEDKEDVMDILSCTEESSTGIG